jgi:hypothetical protein
MTYYIYSTLYQFNKCWVRIVIKSQSTNAQSVLHLNACMGTSDYGLSHTFKGLEAVANGLTDVKERWWSISPFWVAAEYTGGGSKCPHKPKYKGLRSGEREIVPRKLNSLRMYIVFIFCPYYCVGKSWSLHKPFRSPCISTVSAVQFL